MVLIITQIGSWRTMLGVIVGTALMSFGLNVIGSDTNFMFAMPYYWHFVVGGWAFGMVFMATDPVTAAQTRKGMWIYGFLAGLLSIMIRVFNPAYPEGVMMAILFMNVMAPTIDHYVVQANINSRAKRK